MISIFKLEFLQTVLAKTCLQRKLGGMISFVDVRAYIKFKGLFKMHSSQ